MAEEQPPVSPSAEKATNASPQETPPAAATADPVAAAPGAAVAASAAGDQSPATGAAAPGAEATASAGGSDQSSATQAGASAVAAEQSPAAGPAGSAVAANAGASSVGIDQAAIDEILKQASFEDAPQAAEIPAMSAEAAAQEASPSSAASQVPAEEFKLPNFQQVLQDAQVSSIDLLHDVDLNVRIELGRTRMLVEDVLKLGEGSVVELDKLAGDPVDVFVNERLVARGEVLVLNDTFCVRINEIVPGEKEEGL